MTQAVARIGRPRRLAIDLPAVANLVGTLGKYSALRPCFRSCSRSAYREPCYPFVVAGVVTSGWARARASDSESGRTRRRARGISRRRADVAARGWLRRHPVPLRRGGPALAPARCVLRGDVRVLDDRRERRHRLRRINRSLGMWRQFTQWLGGMGIIVLAIAVLPRLRIGGRQLMESELPGPEIAGLPSAFAQPLEGCGSSTSR